MSKKSLDLLCATRELLSDKSRWAQGQFAKDEWGNAVGIPSSDALFLRRPLIRKTVKTKTLYLTEQIEVWKNKPFTLTLKRLPDNRYEVLEVKYHD